MITRLASLFLLLSLLLLGPMISPARADSPATVIYSGGMDGNLEPCGCDPETDFGGLQRRAVFLERLASETPDAILISSGGLIASQSPADRNKSEFVLRGMALLGYDAIGLQWSDLAYGRAFLDAAVLPWSTIDPPRGLRDAGAAPEWLPAERVIDRAGRTFRFLSWLDPAGAPDAGHAGAPALADTAHLAARIAAARAAGETVILASDLDAGRAAAELPLTDVDLLILTPREPMVAPQMLGETLAVTPERRGMHLGRLDLTLSEDGRISGWEHQVIVLGAELGLSERMADWYAAYTERLKAANRERIARLRARRGGTAGPYVGAKRCGACHEEQAQAWRETEHAEALITLEEVNKAFDPDCVVCHSVGFDQPGGFVDGGVTAHLAHVQCESCHGPGSEHAAEGEHPPAHLGREAAEQVCRTCHNAIHSPGFDFPPYARRGVPCGR